MKRTLLLTGLCAVLSLSVSAQTPFIPEGGKKWDGHLDALVAGGTVQRIAAKGVQSVTPQALTGVIINSSEPAATVDFVKEQGFEAMPITDRVLTATIPATLIPVLAEREEVLFINSTRTYEPFMEKVRPEVGATKAQAGTGLETPFTGKGVVVGVIDRGFEFQHLAFKNEDGSLRVKAVWNRNVTNSSMSTTIPTKGDVTTDGTGHATHVTSIAAGSKIAHNDYYGIAPEADIVMVPSVDFSSNEVLEDAKAIKDFAEANGQPWVINMSFGGHMGPHDGLTLYDQSMSALSGEGGILVAALGNEYDESLHASHSFTAANEVKDFVVVPSADRSYYGTISLWGQHADGQAHLTIKPFVMNGRNKLYLTAANIQSANGTYWSGIDPYSKKQGCEIYVPMSRLYSVVGLSSTSYYLGVEVTASEPADVHAWTLQGGGTFATRLTGADCVKGDNKYQVGEGGACIPRCVAVASYNTTRNLTSAIDGKTYSYNVGGEDDISNFSNVGPFLGNQPKPTVAAPGAVVKAAISRYDGGFDSQDLSIVDVIKVDVRNSYYYAGMTGTSMASPVVAGCVALWLQANPKLTYEDVLEILKTTSKHDVYTQGSFNTGDDEWNDRWGYGKIDVYEGLKLALKMAAEAGINKVFSPESPITLQKGLDEWKVLFNNNESFADIALYTTDGRPVWRKSITQPRQGEEAVISLRGTTPGAYLIRINTSAGTLTRKVLVK
ncbi:MAG: S8 family peptidase [Alloprevotella sp.]